MDSKIVRQRENVIMTVYDAKHLTTPFQIKI